MFKLTTNPTFTAPVTAFVADDNGGHEESFKARFRALDDDEAEQFDLSTKEGTVGFLRAAVVELSEIVDANEQPLPWTEEVFAQVLARACARNALTLSYFRTLGGAREGN